MAMGRMIATIAGIAALGLLGAAPSSADVPKPQPGKWKGETTQLFEPPGAASLLTSAAR